MSDERPPFLLRQKWLISLIIFLVLFIPADWITGYILFRTGDYRPQEATAGETVGDPQKVRVYSPYYHHGFTPLGSVEEQWGPDTYTLMTDSLGFKNSGPVEVPLSSEAYRVVVLGDSFTEAVGIPWEDSWVAQLGVALADENVEVLNAGVASYSPKLYYYKARYLIETVGLHFDELMVFIDMSDVPDELEYGAFLPQDVLPDDAYAGRFSKAPRPLAAWDYSITLRTLKRNLGLDPWRSTRYTDVRTGEVYDYSGGRDNWTYRPDLQRRWGRAGLESCVYYMERLDELCRGYGIRLTLGIYPWPHAVETADTDNLYTQTWQNFAQTHGLELIDLFPTLVPPDEEARRQLLETVFIPGDVHYNSEGQKLWAQAVLDYWHNSPVRSKDASPAQPE